jgi:hypothetical protein
MHLQLEFAVDFGSTQNTGNNSFLARNICARQSAEVVCFRANSPEVDVYSRSELLALTGCCAISLT